MNLEAINPELKNLVIDYLYHLGLNSGMDLKKVFGDVQYVCMGGSPERAKIFAEKLAEYFNFPLTDVNPELKPDEYTWQLKNVSNLARQAFNKLRILFHKAVPIGKTERFSLYKVGPIISVSHGIGMPSLSILLHEITKLCHYAGAKDPTFIRIGTSGGVGVEPGTVVISDGALNGELKPVLEKIELGERKEYPAELDKELAEEIAKTAGDIKVALGKTLGTNDFYEEQGRRDGALTPNYTEEQKMAFLKKAHKEGVRNIEMESTEFAAFCKRAEIRCAIICAALLNRLEGDQVTSTPEQLGQFSDDAQTVALRFMESELNLAELEAALAKDKNKQNFDPMLAEMPWSPV